MQAAEVFANLFRFSVPAKWWVLELRFSRKLTRAQQRRLRLVFDEYDLSSLHVGEDGMVGDWPDKWPGGPKSAFTGELARAIRLNGVPGRVRAAPIGRDCPGDHSCQDADPWGPRHRCTPGQSGMDPIWRVSDWCSFEV